MTAFRYRLVVDCTPLLPGGVNGGAKWMILTLLEGLARTMPETHFLLLATPLNQAELTALGATNLTAQIAPGFAAAQETSSLLAHTRKVLHQLLAGWFHPAQVDIFRRIYYRLRGQPQGFLSQLRADLLFCPFTAPVFQEPDIPTLIIFYDLLFKAYPEFFDRDTLFYRNETFANAARLASHAVAISEFTRQQVVKFSDLRPDQISVIHIGPVQDIRQQEPDFSVLEREKLIAGQFLLYPANFWPHKNHIALLQAFAQYLQSEPDSTLKLVLPGAAVGGQQRLADVLQALPVLSGRVLFPGYLSSAQLAALYRSALALIFPSLYEGFGIPLVEAMRSGLPILASSCAALLEVAEEAALYFDPHSINEIATCIAKIIQSPALRANLIERGSRRLAQMETAESFVEKYRQLIYFLLERSS